MIRFSCVPRFHHSYLFVFARRMARVDVSPKKNANRLYRPDEAHIVSIRASNFIEQIDRPWNIAMA